MRIPKPPDPLPEYTVMVQGPHRGPQCRVAVYQLVDWSDGMTFKRALSWAKKVVAGMLVAGSAAAQCYYCQDTTTGACASNFGGGACPNGSVCVAACPTPTVGPTPTPMRTPTPRPTAAPTSVTIKEFLKAQDLGYSYLQAFSVLVVPGANGASPAYLASGNGGQCCPGIPAAGVVGQGLGECVTSVWYGDPQPVYREWWCTFRDTGDLWESGAVQMAKSDLYNWIFAGEATRRPAVDALRGKEPFWPSMVWGFTIDKLTQPGVTWGQSVGHDIGARQEGWKVWPQGILDLHGTRFLYAQAVIPGEPGAWLVRWEWTDGRRTVSWVPSWKLGRLDNLMSGIAVDNDGSLVATVDLEPASATAAATTMSVTLRGATEAVTVKPMWWPSQNSTGFRVIRSTDDGATWFATPMTVNAPAGRKLFGCGWAHESGGAAVQPWLLICTISTGKGPEASDWNLAYVAWPGAKVPPGFGQKPIRWQ